MMLGGRFVNVSVFQVTSLRGSSLYSKVYGSTEALSTISGRVRRCKQRSGALHCVRDVAPSHPRATGRSLRSRSKSELP